MSIRCPDCRFDRIFVVEATLTATGERLSLADSTMLLDGDGVCFSRLAREDCSTTDEVAECQACGRRGPLVDFGFGQKESAEDEAAGEQPQELTLRLTVTVTYQINGAAKQELADLLETAALHAAEEGLLTGESPAEVLTWQADVAEVISE